MQQKWFHIKKTDTTIDLNKITAINWNYERKTGSRLTPITIIHLGTSITYDPETCTVDSHEWWLTSDSDRQALYDVFKDFIPEIPALKFGSELENEHG